MRNWDIAKKKKSIPQDVQDEPDEVHGGYGFDFMEQNLAKYVPEDHKDLQGRLKQVDVAVPYSEQHRGNADTFLYIIDNDTPLETEEEREKIYAKFLTLIVADRLNAMPQAQKQSPIARMLEQGISIKMQALENETTLARQAASTGATPMQRHMQAVRLAYNAQVVVDSQYGAIIDATDEAFDPAQVAELIRNMPATSPVTAITSRADDTFMVHVAGARDAVEAQTFKGAVTIAKRYISDRMSDRGIGFNVYTLNASLNYSDLLDEGDIFIELITDREKLAQRLAGAVDAAGVTYSDKEELIKALELLRKTVEVGA